MVKVLKIYLIHKRPFQPFCRFLRVKLNLMYFIYVAPYAQRQRRFFKTIYIAFLPKGAYGSAGWVSNTAHYDCCHYCRTQERNPFDQPHAYYRNSTLPRRLLNTIQYNTIQYNTTITKPNVPRKISENNPNEWYQYIHPSTVLHVTTFSIFITNQEAIRCCWRRRRIWCNISPSHLSRGRLNEFFVWRRKKNNQLNAVIALLTGRLYVVRFVRKLLEMIFNNRLYN